MKPTCVSVPVFGTRRGQMLRRYADDLALRLRVPLRSEPLSTLADPMFTPFESGAILVNGDAARGDVATLVPFGEDAVESRGPGGVMFPFGNGESGIHAGEGLPIVRELGFRVVFYHTTWKDPALRSDDPGNHMCANARLTLRQLRDTADALRIAHRTIVEMADDVAEGALLRALAERCLMLVVARGRHTGRGSYVDQWLAKSPVPVLVMGRKEARS